MGLPAGGQTMRWYKFTQIFRSIMRDRAGVREIFKE